MSSHKKLNFSNLQAVKGPGVFGQHLALSLETGVSIPELGAEDKTTEGLDTARVDISSILRRARKQRLLELASMVELAQARVELSSGCAGKQSCCCESAAHLGIDRGKTGRIAGVLQ